MNQPLQPVQPAGYAGEVAVARNRVLRNTYILLALSMVPTVLGAWLGVQMGFTWFGGRPFIGLMVFLVGAFAFMYAIEKFKNSGIGVALLLGFTFFMGLMLSRLIGMVLDFKNGSELIMLAFGGTSLVFVGMSMLASTIKRDLSGMGKFLFIGVMVLLLAVIANIFLQIPALMLTIMVVAIALFSAYLLYDLHQIINGGETNYVTATLAVYLDIYNIFSNLLALLGIVGGDSD
jgi:FtsH-binding integral membrane protein